MRRQARRGARAGHAGVPRSAVVIGVAQSTALIAGISREGVTMGAGLARGLDHSDSARFSFLLATPIILAAGLFKLPDLLGHLGDGIRGQALVACASAAVTAVFTVGVPGPLLQDQNADPVRDLLRRVRWRDGHLHAGPRPRHAPAVPVAGVRRACLRDRRVGHAPSLTGDARSEDAAEDVRDPQPGLAGGRAAAPDQPARGQARASGGARAAGLFVGRRAALRQPREPARHRQAHAWPSRHLAGTNRWKRPCAF